MTDLQEVDGWQQAAGQQGRLDGFLGVAGQERREAAVTEEHHDRAVIDVTLGQRCQGVGCRRVDDLDRRCRVEGQHLPGPRQADGNPGT